MSPRTFAPHLAAALFALAPFAAPAAPVVVGFERFNDGEVLLSELHCTNCHRTDSAPEPGPVLDGVGSRVQPAFLSRWLSSPHESKPGTTMPDLLAGVSEKEKPEVVQSLYQLLRSLRAKDETPVRTGSVERGRHLYHQIGCVACHEPDADYKPETAPGVTPPKPELPSVPLGNLGEKYTISWLQRFLLDPLASRPSGRMPQVPMKPEEAADLAAYLTRDAVPQKDWELNPKLFAKGREHFATLGCAACHSVSGITFTSKAKPLAQLTSGGCLDPNPPANVPHYDLSEKQRTALLAVLRTKPQPLTPAQSAQRTMTALNCYACHMRDQRGGPEAGRAVFFGVVGDVDLGDEGRMPPALTGVGAKLQTAAIERTVRGDGAVRPYMATRMPNFGAAHAAELARLFTEADYKPPTKQFPSEKGVGRNTVGRDLMGTSGVACIACHGLAGKKSLGVPAVDLANAPKRLRREWFHAYLVDPGALRPGTRMPSFWPDGKPANPKIKGSTEHQIDSIWVYLTELDQSRLPEGMVDKGEFELKPSGKPIVFRTFMKIAGVQAIAVGFPEKIHAAFDSKNSRWAVAWRGAFIDAEGTWEERAAPLAEPLSKDAHEFAKYSQFTTEPDAPAPPQKSLENTATPATRDATPATPDAPVAPDATSTIPEASTTPEIRSEAHFGGYRLDQRGVPTFLYRVGAVEIEDRVEPDAAGRALRRTITLRGKGPLYFHPAPDEKVVTEVAAPIAFDAQGAAAITTEFTW